MRRTAFEEAGGWNPTFSLGYEDHELWVRMLARGYTGVLVPEPLLRYRRHGPSRNDLRSDQLAALHYDIAVRHPRLYWLELLLRPHRSLPAAYRLLRLARDSVEGTPQAPKA